jgi:hypothetical protein
MITRNEIDSLKPAIEQALLVKLGELADQYSGKTLQRMDFGVFPWHGYVEISFLLVDDVFDDGDDPNAIGDWPHYDIGGDWPEIRHFGQQIQQIWQNDASASEAFFCLVGEVIQAPNITAIIQQFARSESFEITLFDPDMQTSRNYCI